MEILRINNSIKDATKYGGFVNSYDTNLSADLNELGEEQLVKLRLTKKLKGEKKKTPKKGLLKPD